ncbi:hypothetical protein [Corynebacterium macginleyi]|uniref:hypothetical protein n=1 Tax=Corynebacterium macginleyi TaxID=38290 RepID=UPI00190A536D|nr:hypothetical protein [Corynebacterium macginleyi]
MQRPSELKPTLSLKPISLLWLRATHLINFVLIGILLRSGLEMLSFMQRLW